MLEVKEASIPHLNLRELYKVGPNSQSREIKTHIYDQISNIRAAGSPDIYFLPTSGGPGGFPRQSDGFVDQEGSKRSLLKSAAGCTFYQGIKVTYEERAKNPVILNQLFLSHRRGASKPAYSHCM